MSLYVSIYFTAPSSIFTDILNSLRPHSPANEPHSPKGPLTEELLFRSLLLPLALLSLPSSRSPSLTPSPNLKVLLTTPLYFGIAHIHHLYEFTLTHPHTPLLPALAVTLFQFTYTTLFGWFAAFVFLRTGSLWSVVGCHAFCNWMGLPRVWGRVGAEIVAREVREAKRDELMDVGQETIMGEVSSEAVDPANPADHPPRSHISHSAKVLPPAYRGLGVGWTVAYYLLLVGGMVAFWRGFWVLTKSENELVEWGGR